MTNKVLNRYNIIEEILCDMTPRYQEMVCDNEFEQGELETMNDIQFEELCKRLKEAADNYPA